MLDAFFATCMKFIQNYLTEFEDNRIAKICTAKELGTALTFKGGIENTMVQVVSTNKDRALEIERKFLPVLTSIQKYFSRVNHAYFESIPTLSPVCNEDDYKSLDFIDTMEFDIAVQSFSNINRIVRFHVNMKLPPSKKFAPDDIVLKEIRNTMKNNSTNSNKDSTNEEINTTSVTQCSTNDISEATNEINDRTLSPHNLLQNTVIDADDSLLSAVYDLLDLSLDNSTDEANSRKDSTKLKSLINNSGSSDKPISDSDEDSLYSVNDDDSDTTVGEFDSEDEFDDGSANNHDNRRKLQVPDQAIYGKDKLITNVTVEFIASLGTLRSCELTEMFGKKRHRSKHSNSIRKQDLQSMALRMANNHIQSGDFSVLSSTVDNPILQKSSSYEYSIEGKGFNQGWGRRCQTDTTLYGESFIDNYKDILKGYFEDGNKNSSVKMNAAMMRDQLKQQFPNRFSIPGETEIKKFISKLVSQNKKNTKKKANDDDNSIDREVPEDFNPDFTNRIRWTQILRSIIEENLNNKPAVIYKTLVEVCLVENLALPDKEIVRKKIYSLTASIKKKYLRSIVS